MEKRIGVIGIFLTDFSLAERVNELLHESRQIIIGRMGIPCKDKGVMVISLIVDGTTDDISTLTGRLGRVGGVSVKSALSGHTGGVSVKQQN